MTQRPWPEEADAAGAQQRPVYNSRRGDMANITAICIKEEPQDYDEGGEEQQEQQEQQEPAPEGARGFGADDGCNLTISACQGNADDMWLDSQMDIEEEIKQEPCYDDDPQDDAQTVIFDPDEHLREHAEADEQGGGASGSQIDADAAPAVWIKMEPKSDEDERSPVRYTPSPGEGRLEVEMAAAAVKEERKSDEEDEGRAHLFGVQADEDPALEQQAGVEEEEQEEEEAAAAAEEELACRPLVSTTLHPAAAPAATKEAILRTVQKCREKFKLRAQRRALATEPHRVARKSTARRRPHDGSAPSDAPPVAKKRGVSADREQQQQREAAKRRSTESAAPRSPVSPTKMAKLEPKSPSPTPRRESDASSSDSDGGRRRRVAHQPPSWFLDDSKPSTSKCEPRDPRLIKGRSSPEETKHAVVKRSTTPVPHEWGAAPKPGLLPTPPAKLAVKSAPEVRKTEPRSSDEEPAAASPPPPKAKIRDPHHYQHSQHSAPSTSKSKPKAVLPFLPPSTHASLSPYYESRSPLFVEDDEPRKSYCPESSDRAGRALRRPSWINSLLYRIGQWRPEWLKECQMVSPDKLPMLLPNVDRFYKERRKLQFSSMEEYITYFEDGLLLELWDSLKKEHLSKRFRKQHPKLLAAVDFHQNSFLLGNKSSRTYECHCGSNIKDILKMGDLVIIRDYETKSTKEWFAYVNNKKQTNMLSDTVTLSPNLINDIELHKKEMPHFRCRFQLLTCSDEFPEEVPKLLLVQKVKDVFEEVSMFKYLADFSNHNLAPLITEPHYTPRTEPTFRLKTCSSLGGEQRLAAISLIQDVLHYETPSINVIEGGPGTGKTHLAAALTQELVEVKNKHNRDCYVIVTAKTNAQVNVLAEKLVALKTNAATGKSDPDCFRAIFLGNERFLKGCETIKNISVTKLSERYMRAHDKESLIAKNTYLKKEIARTEKKISQYERYEIHNSKVANLKSHCAQRVQELALVNEQLEKFGEKAEENVARDRILDNCDVVLTTMSGGSYWDKAKEVFQKRPRKRVVLIVDDASEATEPTVIKLMVEFNVTDVVLFGDLKVLSPYVASKFARNAGLVTPLMERFTKALGKDRCALLHRTLTKQYRLPPDILRGINKTFYCETMKPSDAQKWIFKPYVWLNLTYLPETSEKYAEEASFVTQLLSGIQANNPYKTVEELKRRVRVTSFNGLLSDRLNGSSISDFCAPREMASFECDIMIVSVGPSSKPVRLNKVLASWTRPRKCLFVCGKFSENLAVPLLPLFKEAKLQGNLEDVTEAHASYHSLTKLIMR